MQTVSYWEAWLLWWQGESLQHRQMAGLSMLSWGRIGKIAQFAGGLATIIDIVGPDRIAEWGRALQQRRIHAEKKTFAASWRNRRTTFQELKDFDLTTLVQLRAQQGHGPYSTLDPGEQLYYDMYPENRPEYDAPERHERMSEDARRAESHSGWTFAILLVLLIASLIAAGFWLHARFPGSMPWWGYVLAIPLGIALAVVLALVFGFLSTGLPVATNLVARAWPIAAYYLLVKPLLLILRGPQPDRSLRVVGVLMVTIGFSFDLLAT